MTRIDVLDELHANRHVCDLGRRAITCNCRAALPSPNLHPVSHCFKLVYGQERQSDLDWCRGYSCSPWSVCGLVLTPPPNVPDEGINVCILNTSEDINGTEAIGDDCISGHGVEPDSDQCINE